MNNEMVRKDDIEVWGVFHDYTEEDLNGVKREFHELVKCFFDFKKAIDYAYKMRDEHGWYVCLEELKVE